MPDIFTGTVAPDVNTSRTTATSAPADYTSYLNKLAQTGTSALGKSGTDLVAGLTGLQQAGISGISGAANAYQQGLSGAAGTMADVAAGLTPEQIQSFMNPYQTNVVDEMSRLTQQNLQRNLLPALKGAFTSTGGLGSQRMMGALGQMGADVQANLTGQQAKELETGYQNAVTNAIKNLEIQRTGALSQADLAQKAQELGITGAEALTKAGALEQAQNQALIDAPMKRAADAAALMKGFNVPMTTTETYKGPMAGVYGTSPLAQLTGLGTLIGALNTAGAGSSGVTPWQRIFSGLSGWFANNGGTSGWNPFSDWGANWESVTGNPDTSGGYGNNGGV